MKNSKNTSFLILVNKKYYHVLHMYFKLNFLDIFGTSKLEVFDSLMYESFDVEKST